jgi:hypothetical protein
MSGVARTVVVTGASAGIGLAAAIRLARGGDEIVLLGRDRERLRRAVEAVREAGGRVPASYRADFAILDEVRAVGARIAARHGRIDVLVNNAGQLGPVRRRTADGFDPTMQSNHLAGFLLSQLLLDRLRAAATPGTPARIVTTTSLAEVWGTLDVGQPGRRQTPTRWSGWPTTRRRWSRAAISRGGVRSGRPDGRRIGSGLAASGTRVWRPSDDRADDRCRDAKRCGGPEPVPPGRAAAFGPPNRGAPYPAAAHAPDPPGPAGVDDAKGSGQRLGCRCCRTDVRSSAHVLRR